jgi:uncharacterized Rmd1/YagE family protein
MTARAVLVGERIDVRAVSAENRLAAQPLTISLASGGVAVLFRYGVVVFFDAVEAAQQAFIDALRPLISKPARRLETEQFQIRIDPQAREGVDGAGLSIADRSIERLQLIAVALSKSVVLADYEARVTEDFDLIEPIAEHLQQRGLRGQRSRKLLRHLGAALLSEQRMVGRVEVSDKPELLWERPDLEAIYLRLEAELEIRDRHKILERKLQLISSSTQTVLDILQNRRTLRVEWYIVILIVFEILLTLYEHYVAG